MDRHFNAVLNFSKSVPHASLRQGDRVACGRGGWLKLAQNGGRRCRPLQPEKSTHMSRNKDERTTLGLPSRLSQACASILSSIQAVMSSGSKLWRASAACTRNQDESERNVSLTHGKANKRARKRRTYLGERLHLGSQGLLFCLPKSLRLSHTLCQRQDLLVKLRKDDVAQARSVSALEISRKGGNALLAVLLGVGRTLRRTAGG